MVLPSSAGYGAWSVVAATAVLGMLLHVKLLTGSSKHKSLPPGPRGLPIIGALHLVGEYPPRALVILAKTHGPLMSLWFGQKLVVVAFSPAAAEKIFKTQEITLASDSPTRQHLKKILHMELSTTRQMQLTAHVQMEEVAHILRVMLQDGAIVAPVRTYIEVEVTNILSRMILKKRFMAAASTREEHD